MPLAGDMSFTQIPYNYIEQKDNLVASSPAGFSNRIKTIASVIRINRESEIQWRSNLHPAYSGLQSTSFSDYFVGLNETDELDGKYVYRSWRFALTPNDIVPPNFMMETDITLYHMFTQQGETFSPYSGVYKTRHIDWAYGKTPHNTLVDFINTFAFLYEHINPKVLDEVNTFSQDNFDERTVSVHIRSWKDAPQRKGRLFDLQKFADIMCMYPSSRFFVSSDDPRCIDALSNAFGKDRILSYQTDNPSMDCFVQQLLLSKNSVLIGTPLSSYTEMAWWWSGGTSNLILAWKDL